MVRADSVPGTSEAIALALRTAEADLCVVVGGFGPGTDDPASVAVTRALGREVYDHRGDLEAEAIADEDRRGEGISERRGPRAPEGATVLEDPSLGVTGFFIEVGDRLVAVVADAPAAVRGLASGALGSRVAARWPGLRPRWRTYRVIGPSIDAARRLAAEAIAGVGVSAVTVSIAVDGPELALRVVALDVEADLDLDLAALDGPMIAAFGDALHGIGEADLAARVVAVLVEHGLRIASAESCTGGRVASLITGVAGASACIHGAIVAYDNGVKEAALGVPAEVLRAHGAVSEPVARAMAAGVRRAFPGHVDVGVGITGIAGPGGGSAQKPVGTVDFAVDDGEVSRHRRLHLTGDRPAIQRAAAIWALRLVWDRLRERGLCAPALLD